MALYGADMNVRGFDGLTPIGLARMRGHADMVALLLRLYALQAVTAPAMGALAPLDASPAEAQVWVATPAMVQATSLSAQRTPPGLLPVTFKHRRTGEVRAVPPPPVAAPPGWSNWWDPSVQGVVFVNDATGVRVSRRPSDPLAGEPHHVYVARAAAAMAQALARTLGAAAGAAGSMDPALAALLEADAEAAGRLAEYRQHWAQEAREVQTAAARRRAAVTIQCAVRRRRSRKLVLRLLLCSRSATWCVPPAQARAPRCALTAASASSVSSVVTVRVPRRRCFDCARAPPSPSSASFACTGRASCPSPRGWDAPAPL